VLHLSWLPYALSAAALVLTLIVHGPRALAYDGHPLQYFEAALMLWTGVELFRIQALRGWRLLLLSSTTAWLVVDELLMVHECVKWKWGSGAVADPMVVFYGFAGIATGATVLIIHPNRRAALPPLVVGVAATIVSVLADVHAFGRNSHLSLILEEGGEICAVASAVAVLLCAPHVPRKHPALWVAFSFAWMFAAVWLVRPALCPARLL
jgi:hypothetical protein